MTVRAELSADAKNHMNTIKDLFRDWLAGQGIQADLIRLNLEYMDLCGSLLAERHMIRGEMYGILEYTEVTRIINEIQADWELRLINQKKNGYLLRVLRRYSAFLKGSTIDRTVMPPYIPEEPAEETFAVEESVQIPVQEAEETVCEVEEPTFVHEEPAEEAVSAAEEPVCVPEDLAEEAVCAAEEPVFVPEEPAEEPVRVPEEPAEESDVQLNKSAQEVREPTSMKIMFGNNIRTGTDVFWCPNDTEQVFHTNMGIIGTMGTGKTQFTKAVVTQLYQQREKNYDGTDDFGILIFDYKGDYNESKPDFVEMTNAKILKPYHLPFNPFAITESSVFKPLLPLHTANSFKDTLSRIYGLGPKQQNALFKCIMGAYERKGINAADPSTWKLTAPTFRNVYNVYVQDDGIDKKDSLAAAMDKLAMFELFENIPTRTTSLYDLIRGVLVIDLSGYDPDIQSLIVAITLDLFYVQMQSKGSSRMSGKYRELTKMILVDEADNFMQEDFPSLKKILKEGREFGVGTILTTQFLKNFTTGENDYNKFVLTWIVHNVADLRTQDVDFVFGTKARSAEEKELYDSIKKLTKHHSIVKIGNTDAQYLKDWAFWELYRSLRS